MRLEAIDKGRGLAAKLQLRLIRLFMGEPAPDVVKTLLFRGELLGKPLGRLTHEVMRGASQWSVGERELFAAFTSNINQCPF